MLKRLSRRPVVLTICIVLCAIVGISIAVAVFSSNNIAEIRDIPADVSIGSIPGFNADTDALHFGTIVSGSYARRSLKVESSEDRIVTAIAYGNISPMITVSENNFFVGPGKPKMIEVTVYSPPDDERTGDYSGFVRLIFRRV